MDEALALRNGIRECKILGFQNVIIEGDSKIIIDFLNNKGKCPWKIEMIISDVQILCLDMS